MNIARVGIDPGKSHGHRARPVSPHLVKPDVKSNQDDARDGESGRRPRQTSSRRPEKACARVGMSTNSRSPPTGTPCAIRVTRRPRSPAISAM